MARLRLLFFGTPQIAAPFLEACAAAHDVLAVVTRPDKPAGRGLALTPPPVKAAAEKLGLRVLQPPASPSVLAGELKALGADAAVIVAYGKILKPDVLGCTRLGLMNVHFSLLPKFRGAAPIQWSLISGETVTGVTLFWLDEGMDTGPIQAQESIEVGADEDAPELARRLTSLGVGMLQRELAGFDAGVKRTPQPGLELDVPAPKLTRADGRIVWEKPAAVIHNKVRALRGGPNAFFGAKPEVNLMKTSVADPKAAGTPGTLLRVARSDGFLIQCGPGTLWVREVQPQGKKPTPAADFLNGLRLKPGDRLGDP